jgi:hypothetical protein
MSCSDFLVSTSFEHELYRRSDPLTIAHNPFAGIQYFTVFYSNIFSTSANNANQRLIKSCISFMPSDMYANIAWKAFGIILSVLLLRVGTPAKYKDSYLQFVIQLLTD